MKKITKSLLMAVAALPMLFASCSDDNDSNPTLVVPSTFQLNTPAYAQMASDLAESTALPFTWSQPNYGGFPAAVQYQMQFSLTDQFTVSVAEAEADESGSLKADYVMLDQIYNGTKGTVDAALLAKGLEQLAQWSEPDVPAELTLYARLAADFANDTVYSNSVALKVIPYYVELSDADIDLWYLIGADIADGSWADNVGVSILPMQPIEGEEYDKKTGQGRLQWIGYLAGGGFKLKHTTTSWDEQIGQGDAGYVKNDGGSGNITVAAPGVYKVTLNTAALAKVGDKEVCDDAITIEPYDGTATVFTGMAISGSFNDWGDTEMTPCNPNAENHDWYISQHLDAGAEIKIKQTGSWDFNKGGSLVKTADGMYAYGVSGGDNLWVEQAGTYLILFNDVTGFIRFIMQ